MSFFSGTSNVMQARTLSMAGRTPTRADLLGRRYQPFANPFFDHANTYLPSDIKSLFRYCRYYYMTHGIVNAICTRAAEYPITDVIVQHTGHGVREKWEELLHDHMNYRVQQLEINLDYQCFGAGTSVTTREGVFPIEDLVGKTVEVLSENGVWRKATFDTYGQQELYEIEFGRGEILLATAEHEWPVIDTNKKARRVHTKDLAGKYLQRNTAARPEKDSDYWDGVRHGIVFGDGTVSNQGRQAHVLFYAAGKKQELARLFEADYTVSEHHAGKYIGAYGLPPSYKALPSHTASASYWYGFVCGFIATDGCVDQNGQTVLTQKAGKGLDVVYTQLPRLGMLATKLRVQEYPEGTNYSGADRVIETLGLATQFMRPDDFVRSDQRETFEENYVSTSYGKRSKVRGVRPTGRVEEVYCCVEPETHTFTVGNGVLTGNCFGNAFVSVSFPFRKKLKCTSCNAEHDAVDTRSMWRYTQHKFWLTCPTCSNRGFANSRDVYIHDISKITLIRWSPEFVNIHYNEATGRLDYTLQVSPQLQSQIKMGRRDIVATMPEIFLQAVEKQSLVVFDPREVFHMRRPNLSYGSRGWGVPMIMPVLKDAFYMQIMKKAQEAILLEHIIPQNFIFPQPAAQGIDPFTSVDLSQWKDKVRVEIARQRVDPAYTAIVPFPVGHQSIGGQGRALLLMPEIQQVAEHITLGMGFAPDLMFGNGNYAGTSVSMRMVENMFLNNVMAQHRLMRWVTRRIGTYLGWPVPETKFKPFRMADDLQRQGMNFQLNQAGKLSDTTLLSSGDFDMEHEAELMSSEVGLRAQGLKKQQLMSAEILGEAQIAQAKYHAQAQVAAMQTQMREEAKLDMVVEPPTLQEVAGSNILGQGGMSLDQAAGAMRFLDRGNPVDMRPQPEVLPPRREA